MDRVGCIHVDVFDLDHVVKGRAAAVLGVDVDIDPQSIDGPVEDEMVLAAGLLEFARGNRQREIAYGYG